MSERIKGNLETIFGPMFSGKTGELIDQLERQEIAGRGTVLFKPSIDNRYSESEVVTHSGKRVDAHCIDKENPQGIVAMLKLFINVRGMKIDVVGIDEAQFFQKEGMIKVVEELLVMGKDVVLAGLPTDFKDDPFNAMPELIAKADRSVQKTAVCTFIFSDGTICGVNATKTQRLVNGEPPRRTDPIIQVGGKESYEARCRNHHKLKD